MSEVMGIDDQPDEPLVNCLYFEYDSRGNISSQVVVLGLYEVRIGDVYEGIILLQDYFTKEQYVVTSSTWFEVICPTRVNQFGVPEDMEDSAIQKYVYIRDLEDTEKLSK